MSGETMFYHLLTAYGTCELILLCAEAGCGEVLVDHGRTHCERCWEEVPWAARRAILSKGAVWRKARARKMQEQRSVLFEAGRAVAVDQWARACLVPMLSSRLGRHGDSSYDFSFSDVTESFDQWMKYATGAEWGLTPLGGWLSPWASDETSDALKYALADAGCRWSTTDLKWSGVLLLRSA